MTAEPERSEIERLKASVDLVAVVQSYGLELKGAGKNQLARCPFHDDDKPSLSVNPERQLWQCFGCQAGGDVFSFVQQIERVDFKQALALVRAWNGAPDSEEREHRSQRAELMERLANLYHQAFWDAEVAQQYLTARGLSERELWQAFRVGYCDGTLVERFPDEGPVAELLRESGLVNAEGKEHFRGCLVVPLMFPDRGVVGFYGRRLSAGERPHLYLPGPRQGVLNWIAFKSSQRVYLTESVLDALSLWQAGLREVTCLHGLSGLPADVKELMKRHKTRQAVLCLDGDAPGQAAVPRVSEFLNALGVEVQALKLPPGKDPNEMLCELGNARLAEWFAEAEKPADPKAPRWENDPEGFLLELEDVRYDVRLLPPFSSRLRVRLCGQRGSATGTPPTPSVEMTEAERLEALQALKDPQLIQTLLKDMEELGYVGEGYPELFQIRIAKLGMTFSVEYEISDSAELTDIENRFLKQVGVNRNLGSLSITNDGQTVLKTYDGFSEGQTRLLTTEQTVKSYLDMAFVAVGFGNE